MKQKKLLCLLLVLCLMMLCFSGCRNDKQEVVEEAQEQSEQVSENVKEESSGMEIAEEPLVIEVPEGEEVEQGGIDLGE